MPKLFDKYQYLTPLSVTSKESVLLSDSINLKRKAVRKAAQRFEFVITVKGGKDDSLNSDLMAHYMKYSLDLPFYIDVPQHLYTEKSILGSNISVSNSQNRGVSALAISSNFPFNIPAGRFITFEGSDKLYSVTEAVEGEYSSGSYIGTLNISPPLQTTISAATKVEIEDVKALVFNEVDNAVFNYSGGIVQEASLKFVENV